MNLDTRIKQALIDINFVERYEKLGSERNQNGIYS